MLARLFSAIVRALSASRPPALGRRLLALHVTQTTPRR